MNKISPRIEAIAEKKLIGKRLVMSLADNRTAELWKSFMPVRNTLTQKLNNDLISLQVYSLTHFSAFSPLNRFEKWAAVEVSEFEHMPDDMEPFTLPAGLYAVFDYKGAGNDASIFEYILTIWLPGSIFQLDDRPHFEVLGDKYKNNDPASEEQIWIPIRPR